MAIKTTSITGKLNDTSDRALKENISDLGDSTYTLNQLKPRKFDWKRDDASNTDLDNQVGFIAQEVEAVNSNLVSGNEWEKVIYTIGLVAIAVKTIQELSQRVADRDAEISALEDRMHQIEQRLI